MGKETISAPFSKNWVFWLYNHKKFPWYLIVAAISLLPLVIGFIIAAILGVFKLYLTNFLSYSGPIVIAISLTAYYWFYKNFPSKMELMVPLINISEEEFHSLVKKWANKIANRLLLMFICGIPIAIVGLVDTISLWTTPSRIWIGTSWILSKQPVFFALVYAFYYVITIGFLLGSGIVGIGGISLLINDLLHKPLKLDFYRRLRALSDLSIGVGMWTFVAFAIILLSSSFIKPITDPRLIMTSLSLSMVASAALLIAFLLPILLARNAIITAKKQRIASCEKRLSLINDQAEKLLSEETPKSGEIEKQKDYLSQMDSLEKERIMINQKVKDIESIPNWPMSIGSLVQFAFTAFVTPFFGQIPDFLGSFITKLLNKNGP